MPGMCALTKYEAFVYVGVCVCVRACVCVCARECGVTTLSAGGLRNIDHSEFAASRSKHILCMKLSGSLVRRARNEAWICKTTKNVEAA